MQDTVQIDGVTLSLSNSISNELQWIGQTEVLRQLAACWLVVDKSDLPLAPRLVGPPGIGKTALAMAAAKARDQELYIYQCTADTRPEDLLITPILASNGKIAYHASPLVTAMIRGAVCILDEGNRMNEKSWASLAPLLDHRRYIESIVAGEPVGTLFVGRGVTMPAWKRWLGWSADSRGRIVVDPGAQQAVVAQGRSLLAAGVRRLEGSFATGDVVSLAGEDGREFARGLVNYPEADLRRIAGLKTEQIAGELGYCPYDEVVHRDNLAVIRRDQAPS